MSTAANVCILQTPQTGIKRELAGRRFKPPALQKQVPRHSTVFA